MYTKKASSDVIRMAMVFSVANKLLIPHNTVTTLEIKLELRKVHPKYTWDQAFISKCMNEFATKGTYTYVDNGTYRTYSDPTIKSMAKKVATKATPKAKVAPKPVTKATTSVKPLKITKEAAADLMANNKGHMFTVTFVKKDKTLRRLNGQYQGSSKLGYIRMTDSALLKAKAANAIRNVNLQTMTELAIAGKVYKW